MTIYEVYMPILVGPQRVSTGPTISSHTTPEAARQAITKANKALRALPGSETAWVPYDVRALEGASRRALNDAEAGSNAEEESDDTVASALRVVRRIRACEGEAAAVAILANYLRVLRVAP